MGLVDTVLSVFGSGNEQTATGPQPPELTLELRIPKEGNAIWESFESFEGQLESLTLETADGTTADLAVAGSTEYRDETYVDGSEAVYHLNPRPAAYETGTVGLNVRDYTLQEGEPDLPFEGFENATLDFGGETFEPESGEEATITLVVVVEKDEEDGVYRLNPALEW